MRAAKMCCCVVSLYDQLLTNPSVIYSVSKRKARGSSDPFNTDFVSGTQRKNVKKREGVSAN